MMLIKNRQRWSGLAAILGGLLWLAWHVGTLLHDFWVAPIGVLTYEHYNRLLTVPLFLMLVSWVGFDLRAAYPRRLSARSGWWLVTSGLLLLLVGNVIEFWLVLLQRRYVPLRLGSAGSDVWPGAYVGWMLYLFGCVITTVGLLVYGCVAVRVQPLPRWNAVPLAMGLLCAVGVALTLFSGVSGLPFEAGLAVVLLTLGLGWVAIGVAIWRGAPHPRPPDEQRAVT